MAKVTYNGASCTWWLRTPGLKSKGAAAVDRDGSVNTSGYYAYYDDAVGRAVRPALWINLEL